MRNKIKAPSIVGVLIAIVLLLTVVITRCNSNNEQQQTIPEQETPAPTAQAYSGHEYTDDVTNLTISIPDDWTKVIMHGNTSFIHQQSSAAIQIKSSSRSAEVLNFDDAAAMEYVASVGGRFSQFIRTSNTSYIIEYMIGNTVYIESCIYDEDSLVSIVCSTPEEYLQMFGDTFKQALSSVVWDSENQIPNNLSLRYNDECNYEYATPIDWDVNIFDKTLYAQDQTGESTMSILYEETEQKYSEMTKEKFILEEGQKYPNFEFRRFSSDKAIMYVEGTYNRGDAKTIMIRYCLSKNGSTYIISFIAPYDKYNQEAQMYTDILKLFKVVG